MSDDMAISSLEFMPSVRRQVARRGMTFTQSFATTPECCPSRVSFFTGQYSHNHGVYSSDPPEGGYAALSGKGNILPAWLQHAGYETGHIGKYLNGYGVAARGSEPEEVPPGWDVWRAPVKGTDDERFGFTLNRNGSLRDYGNAPHDYQTDVYGRDAAAFIRGRAGERPFFLNVAPGDPHSEDLGLGASRNPRPAPRHLGALEEESIPRPPSFLAPVTNAPPVIAEKADKQGGETAETLRPSYLGRSESLLAVDELVARLLRTLRESGELRDTYFIFTSDNGYLLGEHGLTGKGVAYAESVRVPLMIRGPGIEAGERSDSLVANIDLAPTITSLASAQPGREFDGSSLLGLLLDGDELGRKQVLLELLEGHDAFRSVRTDRWMYATYSVAAASYMPSTTTHSSSRISRASHNSRTPSRGSVTPSSLSLTAPENPARNRRSGPCGGGQRTLGSRRSIKGLRASENVAVM